jgi:hypothetical protein
MASKVHDIDAMIREDHEKALAEITSVPVKLFGEEFRVQTDLNVYQTALVTEDESGGTLLNIIHSIIHPDDLDRFKKTLAMQKGLSAQVLGGIVNGLLEAAADRPTKSSSGSGTGRAKSGTRKMSVVKES